MWVSLCVCCGAVTGCLCDFLCVFYDLRLTCDWLAPDSAWLDNEITSPPKDITTHLNPHLIHTNTNTCTSVSLGTLKVSIRNKKNRKSEYDMSHLRLTCASLYNDLMSPPKHNTTHLNPHLVHTDTHTCTSGSLVTPKGSIRNKIPQKKVSVLQHLCVCFTFVSLFCIYLFVLHLILWFGFVSLL